MLTRNIKNMKRCTMKKLTKIAIKIFIFFAIANFPFITVSQIIGLNTFIDAFENQKYYHCIKGSSISMEPTIKDGNYILLQKSSHPDFYIEKDDIILYINDSGESVCYRVYNKININSIKKYYTISDNNKLVDNPVNECQITGKILNVIDNNIWNMISMQIWESSIHDFNINAIFSNN